MPHQRVRASRSASTSSVDDFKRLHGIGPAIERRLHSAGIRTFVDLATMSPDEIAELIPGLSPQRVARQGWIHQARKLAPKKAVREPRKKEMAFSTLRQHYANFTVEFLLDEKNEARRTRVVHVQTGDADSWAGWEAEQLIDFLVRHALARSQMKKPISSVEGTPKALPPVTFAPKLVQEVETVSELVPPIATTAPIAVVMPTTEPIVPIVSSSQSVPLASVAAKRTDPLPPQIGLDGVLRLLNLETMPTNTNKPQSIVPHGQPFELRLSLDLTDVAVMGNPSLAYMASVYAKNLSGGSNQLVSEAHGAIAFANRITLNAGLATLPHGLYRLEALVVLMPASNTASPRSGLRAWLEGGLLQVY